MKHKLFFSFFALIIFLGSIFAQEQPVFGHYEEMPVFPGGDAALIDFLSKNIQYPSSAVNKNIQGRVVVRFVVDKEGNVTKPEILRSLDPDCDAEVLRLLSIMPKWTAGKQSGKPVDVFFTLPVTFRIPQETVYTENQVDKKPYFKDGMDKIYMFFNKNMQYPADILENDIQGELTLNVVINADGKAKQAEITKSLSPQLDAEVLRLVSIMPKWEAGELDGKTVSVQTNIPVMFANKDGKPMIVEKFPEFPDGENRLINFLSKQLKYPLEALQKHIQGKVIVQFLINEDGKIESPEVVSPVSPSLDREAIRVVNTMPKWIPATQNGKPVAVRFTLPVFFKISN